MTDFIPFSHFIIQLFARLLRLRSQFVRDILTHNAVACAVPGAAVHWRPDLAATTGRIIHRQRGKHRRWRCRHDYYARVTQEDGKILWSAPLWVTQR